MEGQTYLDYAANAPIRPEVVDVWSQVAQVVGNASSVHGSGRQLSSILEESREAVAGVLGASPNHIVFTSGATEANNLAVKGLYAARRQHDAARRIVLTSAVEHPSVSGPADSLCDDFGARHLVIPVDQAGVVDCQWLSDFLRDYAIETALVAVMWANNETGVVQPIDEILALCEEFSVPVHCDAVQSVGWYPIPATGSGRDVTMSLSGHKLGAPQGVGALAWSRTRPVAQTNGGNQEFNVRAGTVPAALAAALAGAITKCPQRELELRLESLRAELEQRILAAIPEVEINGAAARRVPNISSLTFRGASAEALLVLLDQAGIIASAGSACAAGIPRPSRVLTAMGRSDADASSVLRFSLGWQSSTADIDRLLAVLPDCVQRCRSVGASRIRRTVNA